MFTSHKPTNTWTGNLLAIPSEEVKWSSMHTFWTQLLHKCRKMSNSALKMDAFLRDTSKWNQISTTNFKEDHEPSSVTCTDQLRPEAIQLCLKLTLCVLRKIYCMFIIFTSQIQVFTKNLIVAPCIFVESLLSSTNNCTYITFMQKTLKTLKIIPTCFDLVRSSSGSFVPC